MEHFPLQEQAVALEPSLVNSLRTLNQSQALAAMELLQHQLVIMQSDDYYLQIPVTELPLPPNLIYQLLRHQIPTVRELKLCDFEQIKLFPRVGDKRTQQLKELLVKIEEKKEELKGLNGLDFREALTG